MVVLTYHKVANAGNFERQINYLVKNRYNFLSISDFLTRISSAKFTSRDVLITFDDGDYSILEHALPVLKKYGCPAVAFVITGLIDTHQPFWWDEIQYYTNDKKQIEGAKLLSNDERLVLLNTIRSQSVVAPLTYRQLTLAELKYMEQHNIAIGNHSHSHPMFDKLSKSEIEYEVLTSSEYLKNNSFQYYNVFAYPNGSYSDTSERVLSDGKIRVAFLFDHKISAEVENPLRISRLSVNDTTPLWKFKLILSGWHSRMVPTIKKIHKLI